MLSEVLIHITWLHRKLERACSSEKAGRRMFGAERWRKIQSRLTVLDAAPSLADLHGAPGKWHALSADRAGQWAAMLDGNYRLIFAPDHDPLPELRSGGLDLANVTRVQIIEVVDYHGR